MVHPLGFLLLLVLFSIRLTAQENIDFSNAKIFQPADSPPLAKKAVKMLKDEISSRTSLNLPLSPSPKNGPTIVIGIEKDLLEMDKDYHRSLSSLPTTSKDGYKVILLPDKKTILIAGHDDRGVIYGVGHLLRKMEWGENKIHFPLSTAISSSPMFPVRGHHITQHITKNSTPGEIALYEQLLRDLMYFGMNHVSARSPEEAQMCMDYGLEISTYMANIHGDFESPEGIRKELDKRAKIFESMPGLDVLFVPGGDPGDLEPDVLFHWLEQLAPVLHKYHPEAKIWVSPQNNNKGKATKEWYDGFYERVNRNYAWFGGVLFGPWVRTPIDEVRKIVRKEIPMRRFPDISHLFGCQYPAPELDLVFSHTLGRMSIQPRPTGLKHIHNLYADLVEGSRPYSEGNSDDVNKFVWSDQDWNPETPVIETLRDYARLFIGTEFTEGIAHGILALEQNIKGSLIDNNLIENTLLQWQSMEQKADETVLQNPRFQMGLIRAYYDAYQKHRLNYEVSLENKASEVLRGAAKTGTIHAMEKAENILLQATENPINLDYKEKITALYYALFRAPAPRWMSEFQKCEFFENIDVPLNSSEWLIAQFDRIKSIPVESMRLQTIEEILQRSNPGPGGYYVNMGTAESFERIKSPKTAENDPGSQVYPRRNYIRGSIPMPKAWKLQMTTLYEVPLTLSFDHLDPEGNYTIRINYTGGVGRGQSKMKLTANQKHLVHDFINTEGQPIQEFPVPKAALESGTVDFTWVCGPGERGSPVAEVWLIRNE